MRSVSRLLILLAAVALVATVGLAQQTKAKNKKGDTPPRSASGNQSGSSAGTDSVVTRMLAFDKNADGKLSREEITDERMLRLFDRADANQDGVVTKEELTALAAQSAGDADGGSRGGPGAGGGGPGRPGDAGGRGPGDQGGGPGGGGPGGQGGRGQGGPGGGGPGGFGGPPPQPGQIMPARLQEELRLTANQKKQLDQLQKEVDGRLAKILTAEQQQQLREMRERGPGGPGGPGGGGPGGPGGGGSGGADGGQSNGQGRPPRSER